SIYPVETGPRLGRNLIGVLHLIASNTRVDVSPEQFEAARGVSANRKSARRTFPNLRWRPVASAIAVRRKWDVGPALHDNWIGSIVSANLPGANREELQGA